MSPGRLLRLARSGDEDVVRAALLSLRNIRHRSVRRFALRLLASPTPADLALHLLVENYRPGDHRVIAEALDRDLDAGMYHGLELGALAVAEKHPTGDWTKALLTCTNAARARFAAPGASSCCNRWIGCPSG